MSSNFPMKTLWRSFFCALVATVVLQVCLFIVYLSSTILFYQMLIVFYIKGMNPFRTGKLVMFQVTYDREWHFFEIIFFIILGIFGVRNCYIFISFFVISLINFFLNKFRVYMVL